MNMILMPFVQILLWIWFLGCTITWRFGKRILVEGMGIQSAEFAMLCLYSIGLISYRFFSLQVNGFCLRFLCCGLRFSFFAIGITLSLVPPKEN